MRFSAPATELLTVHTNRKLVSPGGGQHWEDVAGIPTLRLLYDDSTRVTVERRGKWFHFDAPGREEDPARSRVEGPVLIMVLKDEVVAATPPVGATQDDLYTSAYFRGKKHAAEPPTLRDGLDLLGADPID